MVTLPVALECWHNANIMGPRVIVIFKNNILLGGSVTALPSKNYSLHSYIVYYYYCFCFNQHLSPLNKAVNYLVYLWYPTYYDLRFHYFDMLDKYSLRHFSYLMERINTITDQSFIIQCMAKWQITFLDVSIAQHMFGRLIISKVLPPVVNSSEL